jgi:hypothetical protein
MARIEFPEETRKRIEEIGPVDLLIGVAGAVDLDDLRQKTSDAVAAGGSAGKTVIAYPAPVQGSVSAEESWVGGPYFVPYPIEPHDPSVAPWVAVASSQRTVLALGASFEAKACAVVHSDLVAFSPQTMQLITGPVLDGKCDLVTPVYPEGKYEGLINKSVLSPLSRALYGKRVLSPLPLDFCASTRVLSRLADGGTGRDYGGSQLLWPTNVVAMEAGQLGQAYFDARHTTQTEGLELTIVLAQLAGSLFAEVESCASHWQRVRGSQATAMWGTAPATEEDGPPVHARSLVESFQFGSRNLEEVWRLVLPPTTLLELKRLARQDPEQFRMPDALWVRIIYDFALAYRLRNITRTHLLGALTPLYLGWVASYTQEVGNATASEAGQRIEQLARAYEENKPYLLSRWRWPDRTNS